MSLKISKEPLHRRLRRSGQRVLDQPGIRLIGAALMFMAIALMGLLFQEVAFGEVIILIYGVIALVFGIRSEDTLKMTLIALLWIPLLSLLHSDVMAQNFAVYAFLLLGIGVLTAVKEQWRREEPVVHQIVRLPKRVYTQRQAFVKQKSQKNHKRFEPIQDIR